MIELMSRIGRVCIVLAAIVAVAAGGYQGYHLATLYVLSHPEQYGYSEVRATTLEAVGALAGVLVSVILTGVSLGAIATLYLVHDRLRDLTAELRRTARSETAVPRERLVGRP